jgi:hypothetical protein
LKSWVAASKSWISFHPTFPEAAHLPDCDVAILSRTAQGISKLLPTKCKYALDTYLY